MLSRYEIFPRDVPELLMENSLDRLFYEPSGLPRRIPDIQDKLRRMRLTQDQKTGAVYISEFIGQTLAIRYVQRTDRGTLDPFSPSTINPPQEDQINMIPFSISLCGTDVGLIEYLKRGDMDTAMIGKIAGHEAAGFIVGVGKNVDPNLIGQVMCLDSHYTCGQKGHRSFDDCMASGCDGIVSIRGSRQADGERNPPIDGYWGRIITAPASAMTIPLPTAMAEYLAAPSTLESLGNIYEIVEQLKALNLLDQPERKILVISGLGATGYPLAVIARHYGFEVLGIEPSEVNRQLASRDDICRTYSSSDEAAKYIKTILQTGKTDTVITAVMSSSPLAYKDALTLQSGITDQHIRRVFIAFGLFADPKAEMPGMPAGQSVPQREFVFNRRSFRTESETEIYGVCGRSMRAWRSLIDDLSPDSSGQRPKSTLLVDRLNAGILLTPNSNQFTDFALTMMEGERPDIVMAKLQQTGKIKLAVNLLK